MNAAPPVVFIDIAFPARGVAVPLDHGYLLFAALSGVVPQLHERPDWGVHPILGHRSAPGRLDLIDASHVKLRIPADELATVLPLSGARLDVAGSAVLLGAPIVHRLRPAPDLIARIVIIKGSTEPEPFGVAARRQLATIPDLPTELAGVDLVVGARRVLRVGGHTVAGFHVALSGLDASASLAIQRHGLGGRRHMGAGLFVPPGRRR